MQIVIEIPDEVKEAFDKANIADVDCYVNDYDLLLGKAIKNGIPLPKGHGNLKDADAIMSTIKENLQIRPEFVIEHAPTIIAADRSEE